MPVERKTPKSWLTVPGGFGKSGAGRVWLQPSGADPVVQAQFRAVLTQNFVCLHVRQYKNQIGMGQEQLANLDPRPDSVRRWNAKLNGRQPLTPRDMATLVVLLPDALPSWADIAEYIGIIEQTRPRPVGYLWADR